MRITIRKSKFDRLHKGEVIGISSFLSCEIVEIGGNLLTREGQLC